MAQVCSGPAYPWLAAWAVGRGLRSGPGGQGGMTDSAISGLADGGAGGGCPRTAAAAGGMRGHGAERFGRGAGAAAAVAERDVIQANLLELDGSFVRQVLDGATLTGQTRQSWEATSAALTGLWETYMAYSAVVDRVAELGVGERRPSKKDIPELTELLTGACVRLPGAPVPLARRDLADTGRRGGHARDGDRHDAPVVHRGDRGDLGRRGGLGRDGHAPGRGGGGPGPRPPAGGGPWRRARDGVPRRGVQPGCPAGGHERRSAGAVARRPHRHHGRGAAAAAGDRPRRPDRRGRPAARAGAAPDRRAGGRGRRRSHGPPGCGRGLAARRPADRRAAAAAAGHRRAAAGQPDRARGRRAG